MRRIALSVLALVALTASAIIIFYIATIYPGGAAQNGYLVLRGATVLVGEELEPHVGATVVIRDGVILEVTSGDAADVPADAMVIDLTGYTLMPGLIDLHVHLASPELDVDQRIGPARMPGLILDYARYFPGKRRAFLSHGVTSVRSLGDDLGWVMEMRRMLRDGDLEGPGLFAAGPIFTTPGGHPITTIGVDASSDGIRIPATPDEARVMVRELAGGSVDDGVDLIKVVQERGGGELSLQPIPLDVLRAIVETAHSNGIPVVAHWGTPADLADVLAAGVDGLEHLDSRRLREALPDATVKLLAERRIPLSPTLAVLEAATRRVERRMPISALQETMQAVERLHAAGVRIVAGSDAGMPGVRAGSGLLRELELLAESGLTPRDALKAATSEAARALRTDLAGAIEPGRAADLLVLAGAPHERISDIRAVVIVFRDGRAVVDRR